MKVTHSTWRMAIPFLRTPEGQRAEAVVRRFHDWLEGKQITVSAVSPDEVAFFIERPFRTIVKPRTAQLYKRRLIDYLAWLFKQGILGFDPKDLGIRRRRPLPERADVFLRTLEPTHRPSTCRGYRTSLQHFHEWLDDARLHLLSLSRTKIEQWLLSLSDQGFHPSTRVHMIQHVRGYLRWLDERGELRRDADELLRGRDMPKLPLYLPRPLPHDIDRALQSRLARSLHPLWLGLLVMRQTGLRIGELRALEFHCVRTDTSGHSFLKVPLGKLNNERLVPLAPKTCSVIHELQQSGDPKRTYLLPCIGSGMVRYVDLTHALRRAADGLETPEPITSHRLRHTYATSLLEAGMSLVAVMKLLGHRDYRMTLRYTAITPETVGKEYFEALVRLETRYAGLHSPTQAVEPDPLNALADILAWTKNKLGHELGQPRLAQSLTKRLIRVREAIEQCAERSPGPRKY